MTVAKAHNKTIKGVNQQLERNKNNLIEDEWRIWMYKNKFTKNYEKFLN